MARSEGLNICELESDVLLELRAPELKNEKSYWEIGTSRVSRVKISALSEDAQVYTPAAIRLIPGTKDEDYELAESLGLVDIRFGKNFFVKAEVMRSKNVSPLLVDGILGFDFICRFCELTTASGFTELFFALQERTGKRILMADSVIKNYRGEMEERLREMTLARDLGEWATISERLEMMHRYLPRDVKDNRQGRELLFVVHVLDDYNDCFYLPNDTIGATNAFTYPIKIKGNDPIRADWPNYSSKYWDRIEACIADLLRQGIIKKSTSPYNLAIALQEKKADCFGNTGHRILLDLRELNRRSESESFPIPSIFDAMDELYGSKYFSVLDLASASYQIALEPQDYRKTAFTASTGRYEFTRVPNGIKNASQYVQRLMIKVFEGMREQVFICYDDILVHSATIQEHEIHVRRVLDRVRLYGLKLQIKKCQLAQERVMYLGNLVTSEGLRPDPDKINELRTRPRPNDPEALRRFLSLLCTHKRFLADYASKAKPMWDLLKQPEFRWTPEASESFQNFQTILSNDLTLRYPNWNRPFVVNTDSTKNGIYAGLMQAPRDNSQLRPIAWASRTYTPLEKRLTVADQDALACVYGTDTFRRYVQNTTSLNELARNLSIDE